MTNKERQARISHHMYDTCETPAEHAERIVSLEELALDMLNVLEAEDRPYREYGLRARIRSFRARMHKLGINLDKGSL